MAEELSANQPEIHGYVHCPFAWRVRLAAAEKGVSAAWIPCDVEAPDGRAAAHNPDEHSLLLYHDGFTLEESEVIAQYFDEAFTGPALMPREPRARAALRLVSARLKALDVHAERSKPAARKRSAPALRLLEDTLGTSAFLHGVEPGLSDILTWPFLSDLAQRGLLSSESYPRVFAYVQRFMARPSFRATQPPA